MKFERMKMIREDNDFTQNEIANILNVDRSTYAGWETGKDTIPLRKLSKFCDYFNLNIDYITQLTNKKNHRIIKKEINIEEVGKNLKTIRNELNLKQKDIYTMLNTTSSTYSAYESGKVLIKTSFVYKIAQEYNYSIDWILGKIK